MGNVKWGEESRLKLVAAVIKVEEEIYESKRVIELSNINGIGKRKRTSEGHEKWKKIADLLPPELGAPIGQTHACYLKCQRTFYNLLYTYRSQLSGKVARTCRRLTGPLWKILKKREDLLNARRSVPEASSLRSGGSEDVQASIGSRSDEQQPSTHSNSSERNPTFSSRQQGTAGSPEHSAEKGRHFQGKVGRQQRPRVTPSMSVVKGSAVLAQQSKSAGQTKGLEKTSIHSPRNGILKPQSKSRRAIRGQTRAQIPEPICARRRRSNEWRASMSKKTLNPGKTHEDDAQMQTERDLLRALDQEFSSLSSWIVNQLTSVGKGTVNQLINDEIRSGKGSRIGAHRRLGRGNEHFNDQNIRATVSKMVDSRIRASFHKLQLRFVKELKSTSVDAFNTILEASGILSQL